MPEAHLIIPHPTSRKVLLRAGALPMVPTSETLRAGTILGLPLTIVRTQHRDGEHRVMACELADASISTDGTWIDADEASKLPRYAKAVAGWFAEEAGRATVPREPWMRHGWMGSSLNWVDETLSHLGRRRVGPPRQLRHWGLSSVFRVPTDDGGVVLKQTLPLFAFEPDVLPQLDRLDPGAVARVIRSDRVNYRWIMEAIDDEDGAVEPEGLVAYARLQQLAADNLPSLRSAGCKDRRLMDLPAELTALAQRDDILLIDEWNLQSTDGRLPPRKFTERDRDAFLAALAEITKRVERLASLNIGDSITHGDLHIHNVVWDGSRYVFFDWANAAVGHPFMDLPMWMQWADDPRASVEAYLRAWGGPELLEAWRDAQPVALLHHALTLLPLVEALDEGREEWAAGIQKRVLQALDLAAQSSP